MSNLITGLRRGVEEKLVAANTTGNSTFNIPNHGVTRLAVTAAANYALDAPAEGVKKVIIVTGAITTNGAVTIQGSTNASAAVKFGASATQITVTASTGVLPIAGVELLGINSTLWGIVKNTTGIAYGTS
jgi:redox-sensitive bicupin YhaK (pirin superfamily)